MKKFPFRQVHLDFHNSGQIKDIGSKFSKKEFKKTLVNAEVQLINVFAKCHHGWSYFDSDTIPKHPHLKFNLLNEIVKACKEGKIRYQIYISAGLDENYATNHKDHIAINKDGTLKWTPDWSTPGYHELCMNTGYLEVLKRQVIETVKKFPSEGIWLDIVGERDCYCKKCLKDMEEQGYDYKNNNDVIKFGRKVYKNYYKTINKSIRDIDPSIKIFHNSSHISRGRRDLFDSVTHFDIESLPTGVWGYTHMPLSARYLYNFDKEYTCMTGRFNESWGEFGGFKHPNALKYECAMNLAFGAKTNIGDQMHPLGFLDNVTYSLIGEAFSWIKPLEEYSENVEPVSDVALLSLESINNFLLKNNEELLSNKVSTPENPSSIEIEGPDNGALMMLQESNILFDIIDLESDFKKYKVIVVPDKIIFSSKISSILNDYIKNGGKILFTGASGLLLNNIDGGVNIGIKFNGLRSLTPDYFYPWFSYKNMGKTSFVMYGNSYEYLVLNDSVKNYGFREPSYFNRTFEHFSSHRQTPNNPKIKNHGVAISNKGAFIPWNIFENYNLNGHLILKELFINTLDVLLGNKKTIETNLGQQGIITLMHQKSKRRYLNHIIYANTVKKGKVEVIEDINPIFNIRVEINLKNILEPKEILLARQNRKLDFKLENGKLIYEIPKIYINEIVIINY